MLQIDHIYEFFYKTIFKDFSIHYLPNGGVFLDGTDETITWSALKVFNEDDTVYKILCIEQEPIFENLAMPYINLFKFPMEGEYSMEKLIESAENGHEKYIPPTVTYNPSDEQKLKWKNNVKLFFKDPVAILVSEKSKVVTNIASENNLKLIYYFFHGFAALDWFRGFYAINYSFKTIKSYKYDFISFNRLITLDRSYRCYFISLLTEYNLIDKGQISFGIDKSHTWNDEINATDTKLSNKAVEHIKQHLPTLQLPLTIDGDNISGCASADIPRCANDSYWHIVTETVFYHNKLHLTEKIFKPIVLKQPFMLLGAPGNLTYLKSYGFKTFDCVISEKYDFMVNNTTRVEAVVEQLQWYCNLTESEKFAIMRKIEPILEYNFNWFFTGFKERITSELLDNAKVFFSDMNIDDSRIDYAAIYKTLTT